ARRAASGRAAAAHHGRRRVSRPVLHAPRQSSTLAGPRLRGGAQAARVREGRGTSAGRQPRLLPERPAADRGRRAPDDRPGRPLLGTFGHSGAAQVVTRWDVGWHKPAHRWTIRYTLDADGAALLPKMYRDAARGRRVHEIMRWLWDQAASGSPELGVPRPLGW